MNIFARPIISMPAASEVRIKTW